MPRTAQSTPGVYYHVAPYDAWPDIRRSGLRPGHDGHVWLFTNSEQAMLYKDSYDSSGWRNDVPPEQWTRPPCIVVVRTDRAVPTEAGIPGAYWVEGQIGAAEVYDVIRPEDLRHYAGRQSARTATKGWHYAPREAREDIEAHGLDWRRSPAAQRPQDPRNHAPVANYFSPSEQVAREMLLDGAAYDLYEVDLGGVKVTPDPYQPEDAFYTLDAIAPDKIRRVAGDYSMTHRAPTGADDVAAPFHDVEEMMPDYYEHPEYYSHDRGPVDRECVRAIKAARGNPHAQVVIYRALPKGFTDINTGDWVTPSLAYARQHAISNGEEDWPVITATVPASTLWTEGYAAEWGYSGPPLRNARTAALSTTASDTYADSVMVALRPSEATRKAFAAMDECTEVVEDLHVTLFYLGSIDDLGGEMGKERLFRALYGFAINSGYRGLTGTANGLGVFRNEQDTLIVLWDIPGIAEFRTHLGARLAEHGVPMRTENHGFTPHMTLGYSDDTVSSLPDLPEGAGEKEIFGSLWLVWGEEWTEVTLP